MRLRNHSARVLYLNLPGSLLQLPPLGSVELFGEQADAAKAVLAGAFAPWVDDGSIEVDADGGSPSAEARAFEPSPPTNDDDAAAAPKGRKGKA